MSDMDDRDLWGDDEDRFDDDHELDESSESGWLSNGGDDE